MAMLHRNTGMWRSAAPCGPKKWAKWNELSEETLACENIAIWMMENPTTGGGEVGMGGNLSVADLTRTQVGSLPGAIGTPPTRQFSIPSKGLYYTTGQKNFLASNLTFTHVIKGNGNNSTIGAYFVFRIGSPDNARYAWDGPRVSIGFPLSNTTDIPTTGDFYVAFWCDGTTVRAGWSIVKPTKLSDFSSVRAGTMTPAQMQNAGYYFNGLAVDSDNTGTSKVYYEMMSNLCLIDNNA